ncbi:hypothetical protein V5O48_001963 [Marasmius crinis-equi]|uniref:Uncharacterized protein n=1 Tax=Marasmius crinis-equi TaxID=585013 RepID=A0ABR3FX13_9AGAR
MTTTPVSTFPVTTLDAETLSQRLDQLLRETESNPLSLQCIGGIFSSIHSPIPNSISEDTPVRSRLHTHWTVRLNTRTPSPEPLGQPFYPTYTWFLEQRSKKDKHTSSRKSFVARKRRVDMDLALKKQMLRRVPKSSVQDSDLGWKAKSLNSPYMRFLSTYITSPHRPASPTDSIPSLSDGSTHASSPTFSDLRSDEDAGEYLCAFPRVRLPPYGSKDKFFRYAWDLEAEGDMFLPLDNLKIYRRYEAVERNRRTKGQGMSPGFGGKGGSPWGWQWQRGGVSA